MAEEGTHRTDVVHAGQTALPSVAETINQSVILRCIVRQDRHEVVHRQRKEAAETSILKMASERVDIVRPVS